MHQTSVRAAKDAPLSESDSTRRSGTFADQRISTGLQLKQQAMMSAHSQHSSQPPRSNNAVVQAKLTNSSDLLPGTNEDSEPLLHASETPIQRKVAYEGSTVANPGDFTMSDTWARLAAEIVGIVQNYIDTLDPTIAENNPEVVEAAKHILAKGRGPEMINTLYRLYASDKDYGVFNLGDDQHQMLLIYELARSLNFAGLQAQVKDGPNQEKTRAENEAEILGHAKAHAAREEQRKAHFAKSPKPGLTFTLAILGNGASAAYYLESHSSEIDPIQSVVIGEANPWAGKRGVKGADNEDMYINHPMHMISPNRSKADTGNENLAPRAEFAEVVKQEIQKTVRFVWDTKIKSVSKVPSNGVEFYEIDTEKYGKCYAQHVVTALGTGPHTEAPEKKVLNTTFAATDGVDNVPRVMNLDEFQHNASKLGGMSKGKSIDIFISGGNAAIDAVTRIVRENEKSGAKFKLIWAMGARGAQFLTGTDNEETKAKYSSYLKAPDMGFRGRTGALSKAGNQVAVAVNRVDEEATALQPKGSQPKFKKEESIVADYYVHGIGQDVGEILDLFIDNKGNRGAREAFAKGLDPTVDPNFNFGEQPGPAPEHETPEEYQQRQEKFRKEKQAISGYEVRTKGEPAAYDTGTSLSFIGATASKIAGIRGESARHDANIATLPQNVVGNEQLAPIRSAQESQTGMVPAYIGKEANFAVENKTAIRIHIALKYPNISADSADMWAEIIVGQRRPSEDLKRRHPELVGPLPNPVPEAERVVRETAATYTKAFEGILARENLSDH